MSSSTAAPPATYTTPTKRAGFSSATTAEAGPSRARPAGASPAYSSRRHSLPGSRIWKVGFSGEPEPRSVFWSTSSSSEGEAETEAWSLDPSLISSARGDRAEGDRLAGISVLRNLRKAFFECLMTDPKARKVIVLENTFLPRYVKEHIAQALFDNLKVPSVAFTPSSVLALAACGRITGLVVDCGWLETTVTPVYHSRPLYHLARSTPLAGRALHRRLRLLLNHHATYYPPPASLGNLARQPVKPVPPGLLTDQLIERILAEGCFVGGIFVPRADETDEAMDVDLDAEQENAEVQARREAGRLARRYADNSGSSAKDMRFRATPPGGSSKAMGTGTLVVPGWVRERASEILFGDAVDEDESIPGLILACVLKCPIDLRAAMLSNILVTGGTSSLPNWITRLRVSILQSLFPPPSGLSEHGGAVPLHGTPEARGKETREWRRRGDEPYKTLYGLAGKVAILNDPAPLSGDAHASASRGGSAPWWTTGLMGWVGGSLAGALKTSGPEIMREEYDMLVSESLARGEVWYEANDAALAEVAATAGLDLEEMRPGMAMQGLEAQRKRGWDEGRVLGDWTRGAALV
ncbi:hypothetical protein JCM24511_07843 [Saitozyma sp. JCM 24511]|nr:hypothetical protein JCM24511_07843 [Saitozyma sp. JCM 24511]